MSKKIRVSNKPLSSVEKLISKYEESGVEAWIKRSNNEVYLIVKK